jgi:hypothetical protein
MPDAIIEVHALAVAWGGGHLQVPDPEPVAITEDALRSAWRSALESGVGNLRLPPPLSGEIPLQNRPRTADQNSEPAPLRDDPTEGYLLPDWLFSQAQVDKVPAGAIRVATTGFATHIADRRQYVGLAIESGAQLPFATFIWNERWLRDDALEGVNGSIFDVFRRAVGVTLTPLREEAIPLLSDLVNQTVVSRAEANETLRRYDTAFELLRAMCRQPIEESKAGRQSQLLRK